MNHFSMMRDDCEMSGLSEAAAKGMGDQVRVLKLNCCHPILYMYDFTNANFSSHKNYLWGAGHDFNFNFSVIQTRSSHLKLARLFS